MYGKISQFLKEHWRSLVVIVAIFGGVLCGIWACTQSTPIDVDANRNRIIIQFVKSKSNPNK